jgi:hypothetical protein
MVILMLNARPVVFSSTAASSFFAFPSGVPVTVAAKPSDVVDLPYSPALLFNVHFPIVVVADEAFSTACRIGFDMYFEDMFHGKLLEALQFEDHFYTWEEVERIVRDLLSPASGERLVWRVGMCLGWLSALALTDRLVAERGVELLCSLANAEYRGVR